MYKLSKPPKVRNRRQSLPVLRRRRVSTTDVCLPKQANFHTERRKYLYLGRRLTKGTLQQNLKRARFVNLPNRPCKSAKNQSR